VNLSFFVGKKARRGQKTLTWFTPDEGSTLRA